MPKITLDNVGTNYASTVLINSNFQKIEEEINNNLLARDNPSNSPNYMEDELDMNSFPILNLPAPLLANSPVRKVDLDALVSELSTLSGADAVVPIIAPVQLGDGSNTIFDTPADETQSAYPSASFTVHVNGAALTPGTDFVYNTTTGNVELTQAPDNGDEVSVTFFNPVVSLDGSISKQYADEAAASAALADTHQQSASASAMSAASSETNASTSEANATTSETNSLTSENKAEQWAEEDEDVEVETGKYSAKHWAAKALGAIQAETYVDTTAGLAATSEGEYFNVPSPEADEVFIVYLHDVGSVATEIGRTPSVGAINTINSSRYLEGFDSAHSKQSTKNLVHRVAPKKAAVVILLGQSLNAARGTTIKSTVQNAFMLEGGAHVSAFDFWALNQTQTTNYDNVETVVPLAESALQSPCVGVASTLVGDRYERVYVGSVAVGARDMATISGRGIKANTYVFAQRFCELVRADGYEPEIMFYSAHGESDANSGTTQTDYYDAGLLYYRSLQLVASQAMGVSDYVAPIAFTHPLQNSKGTDGQDDREISAAISRLARDIPNGLDLGPIYQWPAESDRVHPEEEGYILRGEYVGQALRDFATRDNKSHAPRVVDLTIDGTEFVATFDCEIVQDLTMNAGTNLNTGFALDGLEWLDNGSLIQITALDYQGRKIVGTLNSVPVGAPTQQVLRVASQTTTSTLVSGSQNHSGSQIRRAGDGYTSILDGTQTQHAWANKQTITARAA